MPGVHMAMFGDKRRAMRRWVASAAPAIAKIPRPSGYPQVFTDGPDGDRVLLFGTGLSVGWGTTSHDDALTGSLARSLGDLTDRGADVDVLAIPDLLVSGARDKLFGAKLWRFDVIVLTLGLYDAVCLTPVDEWRERLDGVIDHILRSASGSTRVVVVGIGPVETLAPYAGARAATADAHAAILNAASADLVAGRDRVRFVELAAGLEDYAAAGEQLADALIDDLNTARAEAASSFRGPAGQTAAEREKERQAGFTSTDLLDSPADDRFDRIVTMARQLYGTSGAAFALVDNDRVWHKSRSEGVPLEVPRDQSFCSQTILGRGPHVVPDINLDEGAPPNTDAADEVGVRFYAGYPIESPSGEQIGALCVFDEKPRNRADVDETLLRQLAHLIQAELRVDALARH